MKVIHFTDKKSLDCQESDLLSCFNDRGHEAFCQVYDLYYHELFYFTSNLYRDTEIVASDVIHDVLMKIWESPKVQFKSLLSIKAYIYIAIKNKFRDYLSHRKCVDQFKLAARMNDDYFVTQVVEVETLSIVHEALSLLPEECARVFKLVIDGWDVKEIAEKLNKSQSTVYAQKQEAISILKRKKFHDKLLTITMLLKP